MEKLTFISLIFFCFLLPTRSYCQQNLKDIPIDTAQIEYTMTPITIKNNLPYIKLKIDSIEYSVLIDIGGFAPLKLDKADILKLGYEINSDSISSKNYKGEQRKLNNIEVASLKIGDYQIPNNKIFIGDKINQSYIGLSILSQYNLLLDYKNNNFYLIKDSIPDTIHKNNWSQIDFELTKYGIQSTSIINGKKRSLFWDTGASFCLIKPDIATKGNTTQKGAYKFYTPQKIKFTKKKTDPFEMLIMNFSFPPYDCVIGHNFFMNKLILFDFDNKIIYFSE